MLESLFCSVISWKLQRYNVTLHFEQWITDYMVQRNWTYRLRNELVEQYSLHHLYWPAGNALVTLRRIFKRHLKWVSAVGLKICCVSTRKPADFIFFFCSRMADHAGFELRCTIIWSCLPMEVVVYRLFFSSHPNSLICYTRIELPNSAVLLFLYRLLTYSLRLVFGKQGK